MESWVRSACLLCSNGCGVDIAVKDGRMVGVRGGQRRGQPRPARPEGSVRIDAVGEGADRLTRPLVREDGRLGEGDWETRWPVWSPRPRALLEAEGPLSHGFYTSGQLFLEEYYALAIIGKAGLGTPHMDGNTRLCTATAAAAMKESFGVTVSRAPTATSSTATRCSSTDTTWPKPRRCCGPGSWIESRRPIGHA